MMEVVIVTISISYPNMRHTVIVQLLFSCQKLPDFELGYDDIMEDIEENGKVVAYDPESALIKCFTMLKFNDEPKEALGR